MQQWPSTLPRYPLLGTKGSFRNTTLATAMDVGPAKVRRRAIAAVRPRSMEWVLSTAQLLVLRRFYEETLAGGVLSFSATDPVTDAMVTLRFKPGSPPQEEQIGPDDYRVTAELEELP